MYIRLWHLKRSCRRFALLGLVILALLVLFLFVIWSRDVPEPDITGCGKTIADDTLERKARGVEDFLVETSGEEFSSTNASSRRKFTTNNLTDNRAEIHPGYKLRISQKGLDYVGQLALLEMQRVVLETAIPETSFRRGDYDLTLSDITISDFSALSSAVCLQEPTIVTYCLRGLHISVAAHYTGSAKIIVKMSTSGTMRLTFTGASLSVSVRLGRDSAGRMTATHLDSTFNAGSVDLDLSGGLIAKLASIFDSHIISRIRPELRKGVVGSAKSLIDEMLASFLAEQPMVMDIYDDFSVDFGLIAEPLVGPDYIEVTGKGETLFQGRRSTYVKTPQLHDLDYHSSTMLNIWITEYIPVTLLSLAYNNGLLSLELGHNSSLTDLLATDCDDYCLGTFMPELGVRHPTGTGMVFISAAEPPVVSVSTSGIFVTGLGELDLDVHYNGTLHPVAKGILDLVMEIRPATPPVGDNKIMTDLAITKLTLKEVSSTADVPWCLFGSAAKIVYEGFDKPTVFDYQIANGSHVTSCNCDGAAPSLRYETQVKIM